MPIIIFLIGWAMTYIGALFKVIHFEIYYLTGNRILILATVIKVTAIAIAIFKLFQYARKAS
ncbi:hypothetical protein [Seonamhaeicola marinus]|uniref:Uncharacterized protein n=1 Tax=Seonamhaeicola marinus TaxID=1912246 RepID=A0A5D0JL49_9FLAO|nr:hypothetical protein [Seonamhaeicola marinus]TYA94772.1 hypothetical protein FUA24_00865 [Seonamhaeicola marinus]